MARVDQDYAAHLRALADAALGQARDILGAGTAAEYVVRTGRSVPTALLREADERAARLLVTGSSSHGSWGHVALGSVSDRLLHSAHLPLALAPRGFRCAETPAVRRVTVAMDGTAASMAQLALAARVTKAVGADLRVVTFAVRGRTMFPPEVGLHAEDAVVTAVGSSGQGPIARVFLGSTATHIVRHSPVPALVLPAA